MSQEKSRITLDDKWELPAGRILLTGNQALARALLAQSAIDRRRGLNTAGFVSGYRGSPLGNLDATLWSIGARLQAADVLFKPGVNEDLAATAVRGTQQVSLLPNPQRDGVFALWYGKGPGVDRSGDAIKHGNYSGTDPNGGVVLVYGDDHPGKSSSIAHQSEQALAAHLVPSLYPSDVREIFEFTLLGWALSRYSGAWIGLKCVNETVEQTMTIDVDLDGFEPVIPEPAIGVARHVHVVPGAVDVRREEDTAFNHRLPLVHRFVRANNIDRVIVRADEPRLGLVTAGKAFGDTRAALSLLGLDLESAAAMGISLYKVGCIWPLEPLGLRAFAKGHAALLFVEEKKAFLEHQAATILVNEAERPVLLGKIDEAGAALLSSVEPMQPRDVALAIAGRLERLGLMNDSVRSARDAMLSPKTSLAGVNAPKRAPFFCSGCPHNRSTRVPEGSLSMTGIGCHAIVGFARPQTALVPTHMGAEGANWIGLQPFSGARHIFQNMGDGTFYHSGLLAIRAAIAANVNITYKILYNDAVAMTGGQPIDGPISVVEIAHQLRHEGVKTMYVLSEDPSRHRQGPALPDGVVIGHRAELDNVQRKLREIPGCTVLIYEQTCAAEKRRRRKRGTLENIPKRMFISQAVCEGCGDCSAQSTCVSLLPVETEFGRKRKIDQSSCNKDYSCADGFCPSFITVRDAEPRKPAKRSIDISAHNLPTPPVRDPRAGGNIMVAGIGGTGVITVGAVLGMAAHIDGLAASLFDMTGMSQKNGAVYSHVRIAAASQGLDTQRIGRGEADLLLAFDPVAALADECAATLRIDRTIAVVNSNLTPTAGFQFDRDMPLDASLMASQLRSRTDGAQMIELDATALAVAIFGDSIAANLFLLGVAAQHGLLPVSVASLEEAVRLNGVSVETNLKALLLGRLSVVDPATLSNIAGANAPPRSSRDMTVEELVSHRSAHLTRYQNAALAQRYSDLVAEVSEIETRIKSGSNSVAIAVARNYAKLLAFKDEYEVARLLTDPSLKTELATAFEPGARLSFNLAPPIFQGKQVNGRPRKRELPAWLMMPMLRGLAAMRGLRGTAFDPFGRTEERRMERELIAHYEALVRRTLTKLTRANQDEAARLLSLADQVRGFGPVKQAAVEKYQQTVSEAEAAFVRGPQQANVQIVARAT